jgi:hypothetical protein
MALKEGCDEVPYATAAAGTVSKELLNRGHWLGCGHVFVWFEG